MYQTLLMLCPVHTNEGRLFSRSVGSCVECLLSDECFLVLTKRNHEDIRRREGLVPSVPTHGSIVCADCGNHCRLNEGDVGFCNLRTAFDGKITERYPNKAIVSWYFDPLPTNCVADWVCPITSYAGWRSGSRWLNNLAVFYGSCNSDCLFCQNSSYRRMMADGKPLMTPSELASSANDRTACVCYFGGDPGCNPQHSIKTSKLLVEERQVRVCYETNGNISGKWLRPIAEVVKQSGGTIKFDLKALTPEVYTALTGVSNKVVISNFKKLAKMGKDRDGEFVVASILLVPGYINLSEIRLLSEFIVDCDPSIPTALLGFHPHHHMSDLPRTSRNHAESALETAKEMG